MKYNICYIFIYTTMERFRYMITPTKKSLIVVALLGVLLLWGFAAITINTNDFSKTNPKIARDILSTPHVFWSSSEDNYTMDYNYSMAHSYKVDQAYDALAGYTFNYQDSGIYIAGAIQQGDTPYTDIFVQKVDISGNEIWNFTYNYKNDNDAAKGMCYANDPGGYIYIVGYISDHGDTNVTLIKLNRTDGSIVWVKNWGTSDYNEYGWDVAADNNWPNNNYGIYVVGYRVDRNKAADDPNREDLIVVKFDMNGNQVWNVTYDGGYNDRAYGVTAPGFRGDGEVTIAASVSNGTAWQGRILVYSRDGTFLKSAGATSDYGDVKFNRILKLQTSSDYLYITGEIAQADGKPKAVLIQMENKSSSFGGWREISLPLSGSSEAYGIAIDKGITGNYYITGYATNNNGDKDEFFWKVHVDGTNMQTLFVGTYDAGHDEVGYGIASYCGSDGSGQFYQGFYLLAGVESYNNPALQQIYYWNIWSPDIDNDSLSNFNEIREGTNITNPDSDDDGLQDGPEVYTYLTNPLNNDTDADNVTDGDEINTYFTNPLNNDTDADNITDYAEIFTYKTNATNSDTDGDGLDDYAEIFTYETNATNPDTDGDGMPDGWEVQYNFNATDSSDASQDADNDNLSNVDEYKNGTDPTNADTDGDGMPDGWEVQYSLDPTNSSDAAEDADNDTLTNIQEYQHHTNPISNDTDEDGMPDDWEIQYNLNATDPNDANQDKDNDGLTNLQEYQQGTDPTVDNVPPVIKSMWTTPNPPNNATETIIYANVEDSNGISSVKLTYYIDGEEHNVTMSLNSTSGYYYYSLGILEVNTNVTYFITVTDTAGNSKVSSTYQFIVTAASSTETNPNPSPEPEPGPSGGTETPQFDIMTNLPLLAGVGIAVVGVVIGIIMKKKK